MSVLEKSNYKYFNSAILGLILAYLVLNYDVLLDLFHKWYTKDLSGPYSHGLLVAFIVIYLVYKKIASIHHKLTPDPSIIGLILLLGAQSVMFAAVLSQVNFVQHIMLAVSLLAIVWSMYSYRVAKLFVLPVIIFSLSFPVWTSLEFPLQKLSAFTTNMFLSLTGLPYYREGVFFHFPAGIIEIAPECAGLQQLLVSWILGLLFSVQHQLRTRDIIKTLIYLSLAAVLINTIRILIIMAVGYFTKMESSLITKHILLGWIIYGIGIYIFLYFYSRVKFNTAGTTDLEPQDKAVSLLSGQNVFIAFVTIMVLILLPNVSNYVITKYINSRQLKGISYKVDSTEWHKKSDQILTDWKPGFPGGDTVSTAMYSNQQKKIYVYISNYGHMRSGVEPINMDNIPYNRGKWSEQRRRSLVVRFPGGERNSVKLNYLQSRITSQQLLVVHYYVVNGKIVDSLIGAKLAVLRGMLKLNYDIKVVCLATLQGAATDGGLSSLRQFIHAFEIH